ncbi:hypothetical protein D3C77_739150 [compost metagenome]
MKVEVALTSQDFRIEVVRGESLLNLGAVLAKDLCMAVIGALRHFICIGKTYGR